jgi:hypothetical protein
MSRLSSLALRTVALSSLALVLSAGACKSSSSDDTPQDGGGSCKLDYFCTESTEEHKEPFVTPTQLVVAVGESRPVRVYIEPDVCSPQTIPVVSDTPSVAKIDGSFDVDGCKSDAIINVVGVAPGTANVTLKWGLKTATVSVDVRTKDAVACAGDASGNVGPGGALTATNGAKIAVQPGAALDPTSIDPLDRPSVVDPFDATIHCAPGTAPSGMTALGPAITFGPEENRYLREIIFELPVNPALMPKTAKLKHLRVQYTSPSLTKARFVPVANPRLEKRDNGWVFRFEARRLGTYQVFVAPDAGTHVRKRHLTHRAIVGFSMGGIGSSMFGMNHHDMFDVVAPLGGPLDATSFLNYFQQYHFGGFCPHKAGDPIPTTPCHVDVGEPKEMYEHVQSYENWWHMPGDISGTGGTFPRSEYVSIFRDVSAMWGDPASQNTKNPYVAAGIDPPTPLDVETVDYCSDPSKSTIAATGYYDRTFNPDGSLPVIKYCDGANKPGFPDVWVPGGNEPMEVTVAVDLNKNGTRDEGEPVIIQPNEPFDDYGEENVASKYEN